MKPTTKSANGTSFHDTTVTATLSQMRKALGTPVYEGNDGSDKVNVEWNLETEKGNVFTVYDWKNYRPIKEKEKIEWHIGGENENVTKAAKVEILAALQNI